MPTILCYIDSHGFGHATRIMAILEKLPNDWRILVRTNGPVWLWRENLKQPHELFPSPLDISPFQRDPFALDWNGTRSRAMKVFDSAESLIQQQADWAIQQQVDLIVSDIPPLAFSIAGAAGIPGVGITNFAWDWLYAGLSLSHGRDPHFINTIRAHYQNCDLLLRLPFHRGLETFPYLTDCPLVVRAPLIEADEVKTRSKIPSDHPWVLLSFGGIPFEALPIQSILEMKDFVFLMTTPYSHDLQTPTSHPQIPHLWLIPPTYIDHPSLVRAVDVVITKPGYGIVSECLAVNTRIIYTPRERFPEYYPLRDGLADSGLAVEMSAEALLEGTWRPYLEDVLNRNGRGYQYSVNGAEVAASKLQEMATETSAI